MKIELNLENLEMYAHIVKILGEQCTTTQDGVFYWSFGMEDFIDGYGVVLNTKINTLLIDDAAWTSEQLENVYSIIGYASYHKFKIIS